MIYYNSEKWISKADILNRKNNYIKIREIFNHNILKVNKKKLLLANKNELSIIIHFIRDNLKKFIIKKKKFNILKD